MKNVNFFYQNKNSGNALVLCRYCHSVADHEDWCATKDPIVFYAYQIVEDASRLTPGDALILHSLGAAWV